MFQLAVAPGKCKAQGKAPKVLYSSTLAIPEGCNEDPVLPGSAEKPRARMRHASHSSHLGLGYNERLAKRRRGISVRDFRAEFNAMGGGPTGKRAQEPQ